MSGTVVVISHALSIDRFVMCDLGTCDEFLLHCVQSL